MQNITMNGQYTLDGLAPVKKRRPCEYSFSRYIGQIVRDHRGVLRIKEIEPFYTIFDDNTCGSPHDLSPVDPDEYNEMIDVEIEYEEWVLNNDKSRDDTNRGIAKRNLEILYKIKRGEH